MGKGLILYTVGRKSGHASCFGGYKKIEFGGQVAQNVEDRPFAGRSPSGVKTLRAAHV